MSLINEALKKAQTDRPGSSIPEVPREPGDRPPPPPPRKKRYLFGFILSVLVVGLLSALVSTYLVFQLVGEDDAPEQPVSETTAETPPATGDSPPAEASQPQVAQEGTTDQPADPSKVVEPAETGTTGDPVAETTQAASEIQGEESQPIAEELVIAVPEAVEPENTPDPGTASVEQAVAAVQSEDQPVAPVEAAAPEPNPQPAPVTNYTAANMDPQIWRRLDDFEIRGIMSAGAKVLIHDARTQKARTYTTGDLIDGALALRIAKISSGEIQFTNNEGTIFTKVF